MRGLRTFFGGAKNFASGNERAPATPIAGVSDPHTPSPVFEEANGSIIRVLELLIERAHRARASDLHLDPRSDALIVRLRIDGVLQNAHVLPLSAHQEIISRIKIISGLRIDEHHTAQDGRFRAIASGASIDVRVSIAPTYYGENAVLRILSETAEEFSLQSLGFGKENEDKVARALKKPFGMILVTGPTGSGKTTSMYTMMKMLNVPGVSIVTLEDPIEYSIPGVTQIQINHKTGLTFGSGLRSLLRQDPNIIMVGEVRDRETAGLAINTALTGHLVLTTLHTNDAPTTIARLLDMGVEPYLIISTLSVAIGQRLVRRICTDCKEVQKLNDAESAHVRDILPEQFLHQTSTLSVGKGCTACEGTGYRGRAGLYEVLELDGPVREAILRTASASEIRSVAQQSGMTPMLIDGYHKALLGITTIKEVLRIRHE